MDTSRKVNNRDIGLSHADAAKLQGLLSHPEAAEKQGQRPDGLPVGRPFLPGQSGNPHGRPAGLREYIRQKTGDGRKIVDFLYDIVAGKPIRGHVPRLADRVDAARVLLERGYGRVPLADGEPEGPQVLVIQLKPDPNSPTGYQDY